MCLHLRVYLRDQQTSGIARWRDTRIDRRSIGKLHARRGERQAG